MLKRQAVTVLVTEEGNGLALMLPLSDLLQSCVQKLERGTLLFADRLGTEVPDRYARDLISHQ